MRKVIQRINSKDIGKLAVIIDDMDQDYQKLNKGDVVSINLYKICLPESHNDLCIAN